MRVDGGGMRVVRAVREVQAEDVDAGRDQLVDGRVALVAGPSVATIFVRLTPSAIPTAS